jgi:hypothetical protein
MELNRDKLFMVDMVSNLIWHVLNTVILNIFQIFKDNLLNLAVRCVEKDYFNFHIMSSCVMALCNVVSA